jgi:hypothetical protein
MENLVLRLIAAYFLFRMSHLIDCALDRRVVLHQLLLQLGNLQNRYQLSLLDAVSVIDKKLFYKAGFLGINVDLLKRNEFGGECQAAR